MAATVVTADDAVLVFETADVPAVTFKKHNPFEAVIATLDAEFDNELGDRGQSKSARTIVLSDGAALSKAKSQITNAAHALPVRRSPRFKVTYNEAKAPVLTFWLTGVIKRDGSATATAEAEKASK